MANTLTGIYNEAFQALNKVSRELVGFIPAVARNSSAERVGLNQTVRIPIAPQGSLADNTPASNPPDTGDETASYVDMTISKSKHYPIRFTGEETQTLNASGTYSDYRRQRFEQAFRTLTNAVEADLASTYSEFSRAYGTAGTAPFGTAGNLSDTAQVRKILEDNGAPMGDLQMVLNSSAMANLRGKQSVLFKVNEAGTDEFLRQGMIPQGLQGFAIRTSGQISSHTKGTATGFDADGGEPVGETVIAVDGSDSGTILAGDVVQWGGAGPLYVIHSASASGSADGNITIGGPGLQSALSSATEGVLSANFTPNLAFDRDAIQLVTRAPAMPEYGDSAKDSFMVTDPISGLTFDVRVYSEYHRVHIEVALAWGWKVIKPEHTAILLG